MPFVEDGEFRISDGEKLMAVGKIRFEPGES